MRLLHSFAASIIDASVFGTQLLMLHLDSFKAGAFMIV